MGKITSLLDLNSYFKSYETMKIVSRIHYVRFFLGHGVDTFTLNLIAGSLESANSSILVARRPFKDLVGKKSGFYDN